MTQSIIVLKVSILICNLFLSNSCNKEIRTQNLIESFEKSYNSKDWNKIKELISPEFQIVYQEKNVEVKNVEDFKQKFEWGRIMNATNETIIKSVSPGSVLAEEIYHNDMNRMLNIPPVKMYATYVLSHNKIQRIDLDTLKFGHHETIKMRNNELEKFDKWSKNQNYGSHYIMTKKGAVLLKKHLELYNSKSN